MSFNQKKILIVVLLFIITMPLFFYIVFLAKQKIVQHQMIEHLEKNALITLQLNKEEVVWEKAEKEILINGKLFDVKNYKIVNNKIIFVGLYDNEESKLKTDLAKLLKHNNKKNAPIQILIFKYLFVNGTLTESIPFLNYFFATKSNYFNYSDSLNSVFFSVVTPPPIV
ncbi:MAG: hypothetical protein HOO89_03980 [Ferruginibacter sp.]|nr:hypothetical protein [Ferruginibacter sp.]